MDAASYLTHFARASRVASLLLTTALVLATPWICGGVLGWWQPVLYFGVLSALCLWIASEVADRRSPSIHWIWWPAFLAILLGCLQCIPLPAEALAFATPTGLKLWRQAYPEQVPASLPDGSRSGDLSGQHLTVSLFPHATRKVTADLALAIAVGILMAQIRRFSSGPVLLLGLVAVNGGLLALLGVIQKLSWNGKLFWFVELTQGGTPFASFVNRNHAASYLNLCLGAALACWVASRQPVGESDPERNIDWDRWQRELNRRYVRFWSGVVVVVAGGVFVTLSRGGLIAMGLSALLVTLGAPALRPRVRLQLLGLLFALAIGGCGLTFYTSPRQTLVDRFEQLWDDNAISAHGRWSHWQDGGQAARDFWRMGAGLGTYRYIYRPYEDEFFPAWYFHAENQYLETAVELGCFGLLLLIMQILSTGSALARAIPLIPTESEQGSPQSWSASRTWWILGDTDPYSAGTWSRALVLAGWWGLLTQAIQAFTDFSLVMPSHSLGLAAILGAAIGQAPCRSPIKSSRGSLIGDGARRVSRQGVIGLLAVVGICGILLRQGLIAVREYQVELLLTERLDNKEPSPPAPEKLEHTIASLQQLHNGLQSNPFVAYRLAQLHIQRYRLKTYQELQLDLPSVTPDWLWKNTDLESLHARIHQLRRTGDLPRIDEIRAQEAVAQQLLPARALLDSANATSPLHSKVFLVLGCLDPVFEDSDHQEVLHLAAAVQRTPHDPMTLYLSGLLHCQAGRLALGIAEWKRCLDASPFHSREILIAGRGFVPLDQLVAAVLPDRPLRIVEIADKYLTGESLTELRLAIANSAEDRALDGAVTIGERLYIRGVSCQIRQEREAARNLLQQAVDAEPHQQSWRYRLAKLLWELHRFEEAEREAMACMAMRPGSRRYEALLRVIRESAAKAKSVP